MFVKTGAVAVRVEKEEWKVDGWRERGEKKEEENGNNSSKRTHQS